MSEYYEQSVFVRPRRRRNYTWVIVALVLIAAIIGSIAGAYLAPTYLYGKLLPYPPGYGYAPNYQLPMLDPLVGDQYANIIAAGVVAQVAERVGPAVVGIINRSQVTSIFGSYEQESSGSGIVFDAAGLIVTNYHVIDGAGELVVTFSETVQVKAELVGGDPSTDLAVVRINPMDLPAEYRDLSVASFGDSSTLVVGELAVAIGNPLGMQFQRTVTSGIISAVERTLTMDEYQYKVIQTDAAINSGNSGGALVNSAGQVIGINQAKINMAGVEGMGFAIPINVARPIIEDIVRHGRVIRAWLGIKGVALTPQLAQQYSLPVSYGIYIEVVPGGPAQRAGLRDRDIIIEYDGTEVSDFEDLRQRITETGVGNTAELTVRRSNDTITVTVRLVAAP